MVNRVQQMWQMVAAEGIVRTARYAAEYATELAYDTYTDWRLGIRTTRRVSTQNLGFVSRFSEKYAPSDYRTLRPVLEQLEIRPGVDVFLDYGSGKGRVLILAAQYPFRRILGIELSSELNGIAQRNISRARAHHRCHDISVLQADAASYQVPDDVTVAYFYSPFTGPTLRAALQNLKRSLDKAPRKLRVVFKDPKDFEAEVRQHDWLVKRCEYGDPSQHDRTRYVVYESVI